MVTLVYQIPPHFPRPFYEVLGKTFWRKCDILQKTLNLTKAVQRDIAIFIWTGSRVFASLIVNQIFMQY